MLSRTPSHRTHASLLHTLAHKRWQCGTIKRFWCSGGCWCKRELTLWLHRAFIYSPWARTCFAGSVSSSSSSSSYMRLCVPVEWLIRHERKGIDKRVVHPFLCVPVAVCFKSECAHLSTSPLPFHTLSPLPSCKIAHLCRNAISEPLASHARLLPASALPSPPPNTSNGGAALSAPLPFRFLYTRLKREPQACLVGAHRPDLQWLCQSASLPAPCNGAAGGTEARPASPHQRG